MIKRIYMEKLDIKIIKYSNHMMKEFKDRFKKNENNKQEKQKKVIRDLDLDAEFVVLRKATIESIRK